MTKIITPLLLAISLSSFTCAANLESVPLPADFKLSLTVADDYPLVQTGYVAQSVSEVSAFYQKTLGSPDLIKGDSLRRTLFYTLESKKLRISLYTQTTQDYVTEVAIMVSKP